MRIIITGSRDWNCRALAGRVLASLIARHGADNLVIAHGHCPTGVDAAFEASARASVLEVERFPADWKAHGKGAGPIRNQEMVDAGADLCLAFHPHLSISKGTADCVRRALKAGIPTWWTWHEAEPPVRQRLPENGFPKGST